MIRVLDGKNTKVEINWGEDKNRVNTYKFKNIKKYIY